MLLSAMTIFLLKSLLSLLLLVAAGLGMWTMFSVFGKPPAADRIASYKRRHRIAGYGYAVLFLTVCYLCIDFAVAARTEPAPRTALHILAALVIAALVILKVLIIRRFRQFYEQAKVIGTAIGVLTVALVGISAGYYLAVSRLGQDRSMDRSADYALRGPFLTVRLMAPSGPAIRTDRQSIELGRRLFDARCGACHDARSSRTIVGPGLMGLLKAQKLPVSGHPATAESIRFQLKQPLGKMPSFAYLSADEVENLIAYLNTL